MFVANHFSPSSAMSASSSPPGNPNTSPAGPPIGSHNKHPLSPIQLTATGCNKQQKTDPLVKIGGYFLRTVEMFILPSVVITQGLACSAELDDRSAYTDEYVQLVVLSFTITDAKFIVKTRHGMPMNFCLKWTLVFTTVLMAQPTSRKYLAL
jgi:hypothetical protein